MMTHESTSCCAHVNSQPYVSSVSYSQTVIKTNVSFIRILDDQFQIAGDGGDKNQQVHEAGIQQQILSALPDLGKLLRPWYFFNARQDNLNLIRQSAMEFSNNSRANISFEVAFKQLRYENGYSDRQAVCRCAPGENVSSDTQQLAEVLTDDDKKMLEHMHKETTSCDGGSQATEDIARHVAYERIFNRRNRQPLLNKDYFDQVLSQLDMWKTKLDSGSLMERVREVLS